MPASSIWFVASLALAASAAGQPTAFTYQGQLKNGSQPATGSHDMRFRLFDAATGGAQVGSTVCKDNVPVAGGLFSAQLDFGQQFATPSQRFLEVHVRADIGQPCTDEFGYVVLSPRQMITPAPAALHAGSAYSLAAPDGSPVNAVFVDNDGDVGIGTGTPDVLNYGSRVLSLGGARPRMEFQGSAASSQNLGIIDFLDGSSGAASIVVNSDPATSSAYINLHTKSAWLTGGNGAGLPTSAGPGLRMYYDSVGDRAQIFAFNYQNATPRNLILQDLPGANVGIGTSLPLAKLDVRGDIRLGASGQLSATAGVEALRMIRGAVAADGTITSGSGFSVNRFATGQYMVTFSSPFSAPPSVSAMAKFQSGAGYFLYENLENGRVEIRAFSDNNLANCIFTFIVVGPR